MNQPISVFIVDDSAVIRQVLGEVIDADPMLEVIGTAPDPILALRKMNKQWPDVILLDIAMPKMDGITFLRQIMASHPTPVVICSAKTEQDTTLTLEALSSGAVEVINKPQSQLNSYLHSAEVCEILQAIKQAAKTQVKALKYLSETSYRPKLSADSVIKPAKGHAQFTQDKLVVIGASTGGTEAVRQFLCQMPSHSPPIVVVQHMPPKFTTAFAKRLDQSLQHHVLEATHNTRLENGCVYIAPGAIHSIIQYRNGHYYLDLKDGPLVSRHKPSVDVLFRSAAQQAGKNAVGVILTGMGDDGAQGLLELYRTGATTFAQDEESSLVYGMPKEAVKKGAVSGVYSIDLLPYQVKKALVGE